MFEIAKNELKVKTNNFYIMDAIDALDKIIEQEKKYDLILIDVY
jgi:23S rRNA G2069 N7-methylase RlmK/C1962 C5-methylase RlmI